jgi:hypothetical protein
MDRDGVAYELSNPAEEPGAIVYRPREDVELRYLADIENVLDPRTGDKFGIKNPSRPPPEGFGSMWIRHEDGTRSSLMFLFFHPVDKPRVYQVFRNAYDLQTFSNFLLCYEKTRWPHIPNAANFVLAYVPGAVPRR